MTLKAPYLLFLGDAQDNLSIKMARSAADWCPQLCLGEMALPACTVSTGLPALTITEAKQQGAKSLVLGLANSGGFIAPAWIPSILAALDAGLDIISGLHDKLADIPAIAEKASEKGLQLIELRHPKVKLHTGKGVKRSGKRVLTVGTDCSVGKMYTTLSLTNAMKHAGRDATFRATGQCGILVSGAGIALDCVIADFISGAAESLSPDADAQHWDIIEGQGSLSHPAFAGVSLGLLHGSQPDYLVVCHALGRTHMRGLPQQPFPSLQETIELNMINARLTNPGVKLAGISVNTSAVSVEEGEAIRNTIAAEFGVPCVDPMRGGVDALLANLE